MRQRGMRPESRNRIEGNIEEQPGFFPDGLQLFRRFDFV